ncbi:Heterogeneous nuclear ribonucleoprotein 1 [Dendrobium catenatum]|uniref:Heterogeneous nuclear ribonucleoprotein 1 n=2 Tax=Dendrobium catenatum TaxID=906689 RepID=A0A2I0X448_9ASPA|nr:Heterogeneous nuclear ribonucleoprotein 1 [Dendrobium catenatum]
MAPRRKSSTHDGEPSNIRSANQQLQSLLTNLHKDDLVDILVGLAMKVPQAAQGIRGAARPTAAHRKLLVHGFGEKTTSQSLGYAFSSYGEVEDAYVDDDITTGKSHCLGFVTFKSLESVKKALIKRRTRVDGLLAYQQPIPEAEIANLNTDPRKLFVKHISSDITTEMFRRFFEKYGEIKKGSVVYDKSSRKSAGFGYVTFKTVEAARAAITDPDKILGGNRISVEIKKFKKKEKEVQEESVTYAPHVHSSSYAIAPQHYGLQSQVPHPHFSGYEPYGNPLPYQPPTKANQPHFSGDEPYGIPQAYQPPTEAYQPHFSGDEPYGIPQAYQPPTEAYQPHFSGDEPYGIPQAYQPPTGANSPQTGAYRGYPSPTGVIQPPTRSNSPQSGAFRGYPSPFGAIQPPTRSNSPQTGAYRGYPSPTGANQPATGAYSPRIGAYRGYPSLTGENQPPTGAYPTYSPPTGAYPPATGAYRAYPPSTGANQPPIGAYPPATGANQPRIEAYLPATGAYQSRTGSYRAYPPSTGAYQRPT